MLTSPEAVKLIKKDRSGFIQRSRAPKGFFLLFGGGALSKRGAREGFLRETY